MHPREHLEHNLSQHSLHLCSDSLPHRSQVRLYFGGAYFSTAMLSYASIIWASSRSSCTCSARDRVNLLRCSTDGSGWCVVLPCSSVCVCLSSWCSIIVAPHPNAPGLLLTRNLLGSQTVAKHPARVEPQCPEVVDAMASLAQRLLCIVVQLRGLQYEVPLHISRIIVRRNLFNESIKVVNWCQQAKLSWTYRTSSSC